MVLTPARQKYWEDKLRKANAEQKTLTDMRPVWIALGAQIEAACEPIEDLFDKPAHVTLKKAKRKLRR